MKVFKNKIGPCMHFT